jgi:predicted Na+-dependent transporter
LIVLIPAGLGIAIRRYRPRWAKYVEKVASVVGVLFILAALIFGSISEASIWGADWQLFVGAAVLLFIGAGLGYFSAWMSGFSRRVCRTIALETGLQNSTFTISVM